MYDELSCWFKRVRSKQFNISFYACVPYDISNQSQTCM